MHPVTRGLVVVAVAILLFGAGSCSSRNDDVDTRSATQGTPNMKVELVAKDWTLDADASTPNLGAQPVTIEFAPDGTVAGQGPCNRYHGTVDYGDDTVTISHVAATMMACEGDAMTNEATFHKALETTHDVTFADDHTKLTMSANGNKLVFTGTTKADDSSATRPGDTSDATSSN